jgi:hypothetical protein
MWDVRASLDEKFIAILFEAILSQRPSLLNYASPGLAADPRRLCATIKNPTNGAPKVTVIPHLELARRAGRRVLMEYSYQLSGFTIDFTPNSALTQGFVISATLNAGFGVPDVIPDELLLLPGDPPSEIVAPFAKLKCVEVVVSGTGTARWITRAGRTFMIFGVKSLSVRSNGVDTDLLGLVTNYILPKLNIEILTGAALELAPLEIDAPNGSKVSIGLAPDTQGTNPLFEDDKMRLLAKIA